MTSVEVAKLFGTLGLNIDRRAWEKADNLLDKTQLSLGSIAKLAAGALAGFTFGAAVKSGISFNATLQDTRTQIAGMLALAKHTDLADQFDAADGLMANLQERAKKLPGSLTDYTKVLGMIAQPITDAGIGLQDLEDITVGAAVAAKAMNVDLEAAARDVNQAIMGQFHSVDQLTGRILGSLGYVGEAGRKRFNSLSKAQRAAVLKQALTQKQLAQLADEQSKNASGRWDTFKATVQETLGRVTAPLFAKLASLLAGVNDWLEKNSAAVERVAAAIGGALGSALDAIVDTVEFLSSGSDEAIALLIGIAVTIGTFVVPALFSMAAGWIAALAPVLAIVAGVALLMYGLIKLIKHWDKVKAAGVRAWDWIKRAALSFWGWLRSLPGRLVDVLAGFGQKIIDAFARAWAAIKQGAEDAFNYVSHLARKIPVLGFLGEKLGQGAGFIVNQLTGDQLDAIDAVGTAPAAPPVFTPSAAGASSTVKNVSIGPTTINIDATNMTPEQLRPEMERVLDNRLRAED